MHMGAKIMYLRKMNKMTQCELSEQMKVSLKTIQRWETGKTSPNIAEIQTLAHILNVPAEYFISTDETSEGMLPMPMQMLPMKENTAREMNTGMAILTLENGKKVEAPATPEGYAFLERMLAMSMGSIPAAMA